ncbi:YciI family protein [Massilia consociata]|uniref:YciI family protein n=1 Tax=Massilia consociata TaxID=760117 RepID=A0ABV6FH99_9BURK
MRFMIIVKSTADTEAGILPGEPLFAAMAAYHQELARAGVLLDANGLRPTRDGWRIRYREGHRSITDGPFAETKELIAGYTLIQVRSREEAMEWSRRFPAPHGALQDGAIEVRRLYEPDELPAGIPEARERLRAL